MKARDIYIFILALSKIWQNIFLLDKDLIKMHHCALKLDSLPSEQFIHCYLSPKWLMDLCWVRHEFEVGLNSCKGFDLSKRIKYISFRKIIKLHNGILVWPIVFKWHLQRKIFEQIISRHSEVLIEVCTNEHELIGFEMHLTYHHSQFKVWNRNFKLTK